MARLLTASSSEYLESTTTPITAQPFTVAGWFRTTNTTDLQTIFDLADSATGQNFMIFVLNSGAKPLRMSINDGTTTTYDVGAISVDTWQHAAMVCAAADDNSVFLDGSETNKTSPRSPSGIDRISIGRRYNAGSPHRYFDGRLADFCMWDVALSNDEITALANGLHPLRVRPTNIVAYWPLFGNDSPEPDISGNGYSLTISGTSKANHAPITPFTPRWSPTTFASTTVATVSLDTLTLASSIEDLSVSGGETTVPLDALSLTSSIEDLMAVLGGPIDAEFDSLQRTPYSEVTVERWLPEWTAQIGGLSGGATEQFAHGHSVSVAVDGNGAGEDIIFRARSGSYANPQDGTLYVAVIKGNDLDDPTGWDGFWAATVITNCMYPAWTANSGAAHGGSVATAIWDDGGTLKGRAFCITTAGDLKYVDVTLSTGTGSAATTIASLGTGVQLASMQIAACKYDEVFVLLNQQVEASLETWQPDIYGSFIRRYYDSGGWTADDSFHLLTHAEAGLLRDTPNEGSDFGDTSADLLAANWQKRYCGGLAVNNIDDDTVIVSVGLTHWRRWGLDTHSQGVRSFIYRRDNGWWGPLEGADRYDFTDGTRLIFSTFARGFEIEGANFIVWNRSTEPSDYEQQYDDIYLLRIEEVVYAKLSSDGKYLTQFVYLGDQANLTSASIIALNHDGNKLLYAIGWRSVYESPPAAFLCSVPTADQQDLAGYATRWSAVRDDQQSMSLDVTLKDPSIINTTPTIVKSGALAKIYFGNPSVQMQVGQGFMETDNPELVASPDGKFSEGATINFRAEDILLNTRAESLEDTLPQSVVSVTPDDPIKNIEVAQGVWNLDTIGWGSLFFPGTYDALDGLACWRLFSLPVQNRTMPYGSYIAGDPASWAQARKGTWHQDICWLDMDPETSGAIEASLRFGDIFNQADFTVGVGMNLYGYDSTISRSNGVITSIQWDINNFGGVVLPPGTPTQYINAQNAVMAGLVFYASEIGKRYTFVWESNSDFSTSSWLDENYEGMKFDTADYSSPGAGSNKLYLIITDYDGEDWIHESVEGITATGLTPGYAADLKVQILEGTIYCYYRTHSTGAPNQWRLAFTHSGGRFGAGRFGIVGRGHGGYLGDIWSDSGELARTLNVVDFWNISVSNGIEDQPMEDRLARYAWQGYTPTGFNRYVEDDTQSVTAGNTHPYSDLLENPVIDFEISIPANGNEAGVYLRGVSATNPTNECIKLGLVPHSTPNSATNPVNYYVVKRRYSGGAEVTSARNYSPLPVQLSPGVSVPVRISIRGPFYNIWVNNNYVGHFVDQTALGLRYGLYAEGGTGSFTRINVPELYEVPSFAILEPNQAMSDAIRKVIGKRRVKAHYSGDGTLIFGYFLTRDTAPDLHENYYWVSNIRRNPRYLSKVRVQGAVSYAIYQSHVLAARGQRYEVVNNPEIVYREFAYREAQKIITEIAEQQLEATFTGAPDPRFDPEDESTATFTRQSLSGGFTIISVTINFRFGDDPQADGTVVARQQVAL